MVTIEQEMAIMKAEEFEEYIAKHDVKSGKEEGAPDVPLVQFFSARVPSDHYYKEKIKTLTKENDRLRNERDALIHERDQLKRDVEYHLSFSDDVMARREDEVLCKYAEYEERIAKLERALIDATLR